jgi:hypothetical protein
VPSFLARVDPPVRQRGGSSGSSSCMQVFSCRVRESKFVLYIFTRLWYRSRCQMADHSPHPPWSSMCATADVSWAIGRRMASPRLGRRVSSEPGRRRSQIEQRFHVNSMTELPSVPARSLPTRAGLLWTSSAWLRRSDVRWISVTDQSANRQYPLGYVPGASNR